MFAFKVGAPLWECSLSVKGIAFVFAFARFSVGLVHVDLMENRHKNLNAVSFYFLYVVRIFTIRYTLYLRKFRDQKLLYVCICASLG